MKVPLLLDSVKFEAETPRLAFIKHSKQIYKYALTLVFCNKYLHREVTPASRCKELVVLPPRLRVNKEVVCLACFIQKVITVVCNNFVQSSFHYSKSMKLNLTVFLELKHIQHTWLSRRA